MLIEVLNWARANHCPWDEHTRAFAGRNGHLELLKWARANQRPRNEMPCASAAENGHLQSLKWARANGCPWKEKTLYSLLFGYVGVCTMNAVLCDPLIYGTMDYHKHEHMLYLLDCYLLKLFYT